MVLGQPRALGFLDSKDSLFRPMGKPMFFGFQAYEVACLDSGYVGTCLSEDERSELEKQLKKRSQTK
jgi:hypothetical protein